MSARSRFPWTVALVIGSLTFWAGVLTYSAIVIAHSFARIGSYLVAAVLEQFLQSLASMIYVLLALEVVRAAIIWATQGPIPALSWIASRVAVWQGL
jgi:hypothetical protein